MAALMAIGAGLSACATAKPPPAPPPPAREARQLPPRSELPTYYRLRHTPVDRVPVRVAMILPLSNPNAETRAIADALEKAAELALFDSGNANIIIMPRDDGGSPEVAAQTAARAIDEGAEIILGPLFSQSVTAVAPVARAKGVPVIAFSSDRSVGGEGIYLLSFQPEDEVARVISYAAQHGHSNFAALVPQNAYGGKVEKAFRDSVGEGRGKVVEVGRFESKPELVAGPARTVAAAQADAILVAQGGPILKAIAPALSPTPNVKLLGTSLWNDASLQRETLLQGAWFAAPVDNQWRGFVERYSATYGARPPRIATLAYDAMSLVALLSKGEPYQRYSERALTDANGFSGVDGIFRFHIDGSAERGLQVMEVTATGFRVVDPAPRTFQTGAGS
jgi:ABC-type branched-subunit amino acid transport system substrate-binding protein